MLRERREAATALATKLQRAEAALDDAIIAMGELFTGLPQAQTAANVSPVSSGAAISLASSAIGSLCNGRADVVALHHELERVRVGLGLRNFKIVGTGDAAKILEPKGDTGNDDAPIASTGAEAA